MRASASLAGRNVLLTLRGESGQPTMSWQLANATPTSFNGPTLGAGGAPKAVAIEELVLAAENIQIVAPHTFGTVSRFNPVIRP
jgi:phage tail-like protein